MFSGCQSVRSLKYPLSTCTWVRWSIRPTVKVLRHVRPSICPSVRLSPRPSGEVSGHLPENALREWPEILQAHVSWLPWELIRLWSRSVEYQNFCTILTDVTWVKFGVSGHFPDNALRKWSESLHADVSWPLSELISLWCQSVDFSNFGTILTYWNGSNLGFPRICRRTHGGNRLKFFMVMYLNHFQNRLFYAPGLWIFLMLALFWLSETGQIWGFRAFAVESMEGIAWNFIWSCILTTFRTV